MKSFIFSFCLLIPLAIIFVIIDRNDFYSGNDALIHEETEGKNSPTPYVITYAKPETPTTVKPVYTSPITETKPHAEPGNTETPAVTETFSFETESNTATKETEKLTGVPFRATETKPPAEGAQSPSAVPVITAEDAGKRNAEALEYVNTEKRRKEPFFSLYQNSKLETICFEGTVRTVSVIPDPAKNDYDNCLYAVFVEIDSLFSDVTPDTSIACEGLVNVPIMKDKTILQDNILYPGDKIWCTCAEYDTMPQDIQEIQLSDDIQSYEIQQYFPIRINKISDFHKGGNRNFAKREITILPIQILPKDEKAATLRKERIQSEINRVEEEIKKHGGSFKKWKEEYSPIEEKYIKMCDEGYSTWINDSFFSAGMNESRFRNDQFLKGILPYKQYLEKHNIDLVVLRVPTKGDFAARVLASEDFQENPKWIECYYELLKNDIEIVDPMHQMWLHRFDYPLFYFYHVSNENHPLEGTAFIASEVLSEVLKRYSYTKDKDEITLKTFSYEDKSPYRYWPSGNNKFDSSQQISFKGAVKNDKPVDSAVNSGSPFLFTSNSFFIFPSRNDGATVPSYTAYFLQTIPDWLYQAGVGVGPMLKNLISKPDLLSNRKVVVIDLIGGPTAGDSFPLLPKYILDGASKLSLEKSFSSFDDEKDICKVKSNSNVSVSKNELNETVFKGNTSAGFELDFTFDIDPIPEKDNCMLRMNFAETGAATFSLIDLKNNSTLDFGTIGTGLNQSIDFFTTVSSETQKVQIKCSFYKGGEITLRNIEMWYY